MERIGPKVRLPLRPSARLERRSPAAQSPLTYAVLPNFPESEVGWGNRHILCVRELSGVRIL
jgi:hypothetical protein